jgi:hypothetical protein
MSLKEKKDSFLKIFKEFEIHFLNHIKCKMMYIFNAKSSETYVRLQQN